MLPNNGGMGGGLIGWIDWRGNSQYIISVKNINIVPCKANYLLLRNNIGLYKTMLKKLPFFPTHTSL
jgi:hypothetical protein